MKTAIKILLPTVLCILFFSCNTTPKPIERKKPQNNTTYNVEYLFEYDGCKVYRFWDEGHYVYFTNCRNGITSIEKDSTAHRITTLSEIPIK